MKRIFKNCTLTFTQCERISEFKYNYHAVKKENVYVFTDSNIKSIKYVDFAEGFKPKIKRCKSLKIIGGAEITIEQYNQEVLNWKNQ